MLVELLPKGEWKPKNPGYDFLKLIDEEEQRNRDLGEREAPAKKITSTGETMSAAPPHR